MQSGAAAQKPKKPPKIPRNITHHNSSYVEKYVKFQEFLNFWPFGSLSMLSLFVDRIIVDKTWSCFIGSPPMTARGCSQQVRDVNHCTAAVGRCRFCAGISQERSGLAAPLVRPSGTVKRLRSRLGRRRLLSARPAELRLASRAP